MDKETVIKHLLQLRATIAHMLKQPGISPWRFNDARAQLIPLDEQLRNLGVDLEPLPQAAPAYRVLSRAERRQRQRASKFGTYEQRVQHKLAKRSVSNDA